MTVTAAKLRAVVEADTSKGQAGLRAFGKEVTQTANTTRSGLGGIGSAMGGLGGIAAGLGVAFGAAQVLKFGQDAVMAASAADESMNKMNVVFGASSGAIKAFSQNAAQDLGMSSQQAIEAAGTFGNLLTSMGLNQAGAASMSQGIVQLAADLGSFNNIPIDIMLEKMRSGMVGEVEPLRAVGINLSAAEVKAKALALGLGDVNGVVSQSATLQARYALMLDQSKNAQGDFARTSDGLANSLKIAQSEVTNLKAELGKLVIKPYTVVVHTVAEGVGNINNAMSQGGKDERAYGQAFNAYQGAVQRTASAQEELNAALRVGDDLETRIAQKGLEVAQANEAIALAAYRAAEGIQEVNLNGVQIPWWAGSATSSMLGLADAMERVKAAQSGASLSSNAWMGSGSGDFYGAIFKNDRAQDTAEGNAAKDRREKQRQASEDIARDYQSKMQAANAAIASDLKGEMTAGMDTAIGLLDLRGPDAKDPNGPFRDMYRVLDVAKLGNASPWQQGLGIDQAQATEIGAKFEKGIWDDTVTKFIDVEALKKSVKDKQLGQAFMDAFAESLAAGGTGTDGKKKAGVGATVIPTMLSSIDAQLVTDGKKFGAKGEAAYDLIEGGFLDKAKKSTAFVSMVDAMVDNSLGRYTN